VYRLGRKTLALYSFTLVWLFESTTFHWSHITTHIDVVVVDVLVTVFKKCPRLCRLKSDKDKIWQDCSSSKQASIEGVGFQIWRHSFKMAAMTSFHAETCCHLHTQSLPDAHATASVSSWSTIHSSRCPHFASASDWKPICYQSHFPDIFWIFNWPSWSLANLLQWT